ncbi:hypothetical protein B0T26DRAFT_787585 [Lasiosphaeria miniovina]|uniref:NmrA-like domain-containing protein n=1 Tax=Lasiosphaeria miniovina TaxID=1954250 RepID=A0AA40DQY9_9PEZI|nr:uncharacterized protein B0T26DRAFT_787585 [Lasiosphaeria miniovina]KAK0710226.1 hypothetical protein B0T26DRAFT_787585 [Lasiosphaeria miniovina]
MVLQRNVPITGATGNQGQGVVRRRLEAGHQVWAWSRDPSSASARATVALMIASMSLKVGQQETFPGWGPDYPTYVSWLARHSVEELVRGAGFAQWAIPVFLPGRGEDDRTLRVAWRRDTKLGWFDGADVGVVVAAVLGEPGRYAGREIDLGVEALTIGEVADKPSSALGGAEVKVHYYSDEELAQGKAKQDYRVLAAMHWSNAVETASSAAAAKEFARLTSVSGFLGRNRDKLL